MTALVRLLLLGRALRDFSDGFVAVLLPVYLLVLGYTAVEVGFISTVALLGSTLLTLAIGAIGHRFGYRHLLIAAACLTAVTGLAFAVLESLWPLAVVAFLGTINPSAGSVSIFVPIEHALLSKHVTASDRTGMFARYSLAGALAGSAGALAAASPELLGRFGLGQLTALKMMFVLYVAIGLVLAFIYRKLPRDPIHREGVASSALGPSRRIVYRLAALFSVDAFAGGFVVQPLLALWLFQRFNLSLTEASVFFFLSGVLSAFSFPVAAVLARRLGLVNTMVFTHIPSSICLILAAFAPSLPIALVLLSIRAALSQMDVPTRSSYVMAVVTEPERSAAASFTSVPRSLAASFSPVVAGALLSTNFPALPLIICGSLKIVYDVMLLLHFRNIKPPEEQ